MSQLNEHEKAIITKYDLYFEGRLSKTEKICEQLEKECSEIKTDFRWLIGIMLAGFGSLIAMNGTMFAMMSHGFKWL